MSTQVYLRAFKFITFSVFMSSICIIIICIHNNTKFAVKQKQSIKLVLVRPFEFMETKNIQMHDVKVRDKVSGKDLRKAFTQKEKLGNKMTLRDKCSTKRNLFHRLLPHTRTMLIVNEIKISIPKT